MKIADQNISTGILRQNILEDLGWNIYRIWSTDWWLDPKKELRKVDRYIQKLI